MKRPYVIILSGGLACGLALAVLVSGFVWLPDVISRREIVTAKLIIGNGETVQVSQVWVGDGYLTRVRHTKPVGDSVSAVGSPDAAKAWKCTIDHDTNSASVRIRLNGREWHYYPNSLSLDLGDGHTNVAN